MVGVMVILSSSVGKKLRNPTEARVSVTLFSFNGNGNNHPAIVNHANSPHSTVQHKQYDHADTRILHTEWLQP